MASLMPQAVSRSKDRALFASAKWKWEPTWIGRSPWLTTMSAAAAAGVTTISARGARMTSPGSHGMGWWTVTSFVPSGKVASTCTSSSISGTPSMTSSRLRTCRPVLGQFRHAPPVPGPLEHVGSDERHRLGMVELESPLAAVRGQHAGDVHQ